MLTVMFTYLFGGALAGSPEAYLQFLLPGIIVQTVLFTTVYTCFNFSTDIAAGIFDRFRSMPLWMPSPIVGAMAGDMVRCTASALVVIGLGLIMEFRPGAGVTGVVLAVLLLDLFGFGVGWVDYPAGTPGKNAFGGNDLELACHDAAYFRFKHLHQSGNHAGPPAGFRQGESRRPSGDRDPRADGRDTEP